MSCVTDQKSAPAALHRCHSNASLALERLRWICYIPYRLTLTLKQQEYCRSHAWIAEIAVNLSRVAWKDQLAIYSSGNPCRGEFRLSSAALYEAAKTSGCQLEKYIDLITPETGWVRSQRIAFEDGTWFLHHSSDRLCFWSLHLSTHTKSHLVRSRCGTPIELAYASSRGVDSLGYQKETDCFQTCLCHLIPAKHNSSLQIYCQRVKTVFAYSKIVLLSTSMYDIHLIICINCEYLVLWGGTRQDTALNGRTNGALGRLPYCYGHITIRGNSAGLAFCASGHLLRVSAWRSSLKGVFLLLFMSYM